MRTASIVTGMITLIALSRHIHALKLSSPPVSTVLDNRDFLCMEKLYLYKEELPKPETWKAPDGFPDKLDTSKSFYK